jgi:hypothetical protein
MMNKFLVFDMDGTIADLYGVEGWLDDIHARDARPYAEARPLVDMEKLNDILNQLKEFGWYIIITSWLAKDSTKAYDTAVRKAKKEWLEAFGFPYDEIHLVKYGTTKADCTRKHGGRQVLFDDNAKVRNGWHLGEAIDATEMMEYLATLL